jgi:HlyD family secretion protein
VKLNFVRLMAILGVLALAAGGYAWLRLRQSDGEQALRTVKLERGPLQAVVAASGTLNAVTTVQVGSQISGQVMEIYADFNTSVKKDQVIARIDPATFELRVAQARADLDAAKSAVAVARSTLTAQQAELARVKVNLADAQRDFDRKQALVDKKFISPAELDKARTLVDATREQLNGVHAQIGVNESQVTSALAAVKQRESLLRQAQVDLDRTIIRAPVDGTVILRNIDAGQTVAASLQAPVLFTIAQDLRDMQVEAAIDEADVGRLRVGQRANFTVDAFPRRNFTGEIRQIRKSPVNVQNVISYTVVISAANPDLALLPGMTANVRVVVESRDNVLKVANAALRYRPAGAPEAKSAAVGQATAPATGNALQQFRQRVYGELKPDDAQRAKLDQVFDDVRAKFAALRELPEEAGRRKAAERLRAESTTRVLELLTDAQKPAYERLVAELGSARGGTTAATGRLWTRGPDGQAVAVEVRTGLTDGTSTEILEGPLKEGDEVILGAAEPSAAAKKAGGPSGPRPF